MLFLSTYIRHRSNLDLALLTTTMASDSSNFSSDSSSDSNSSNDSNSSYCGIDSSRDSDSSYSSVDSSYNSLPRHKHRLPQKRARLCTAQQAQAHPVPTTPVVPSHRQLRSIPSLWTKLELENCSPEFPDLYTAPSHSGVPKGHGTIFVIVAGIDVADLHQTFAHRAKLSLFCSMDEATTKGLLLFLFPV